jgi:hypothetical protein
MAFVTYFSRDHVWLRLCYTARFVLHCSAKGMQRCHYIACSQRIRWYYEVDAIYIVSQETSIDKTLYIHEYPFATWYLKIMSTTHGSIIGVTP